MPQKCPYWDIFDLPFCRLHQSQIPNVLPDPSATCNSNPSVVVELLFGIDASKLNKVPTASYWFMRRVHYLGSPTTNITYFPPWSLIEKKNPNLQKKNFHHQFQFLWNLRNVYITYPRTSSFQDSFVWQFWPFLPPNYSGNCHWARQRWHVQLRRCQRPLKCTQHWRYLRSCLKDII